MSSCRYEFVRDIPVIEDVDVAVIGGGPGGLGAAVAAARQGARTLLVERYGALGGMASFGEVHPFMPNHLGKVCLDKPVYVDWMRAMRRYCAPDEAFDPDLHAHEQRRISKEAAMLAAEDLCLEAGVKLLYHHQLADVLSCEGSMQATVLLSKSGFSAVRAKVFIDATGDGDLAAAAGCPFEQGGPSGHCQPMTLCFKLSHIDRERMAKHGEINRLYQQAKAEGRLQCPREDVLMFGWFEPDILHFNTTRIIHHDATDGRSLSHAELEGRRQVRQYLEFFRSCVPGFENARLHSMAHHVGVRESRRIRGRAYLVKADFMQRRKFPDAIARVRYMIDIHNPDGSGTEHLHLGEGEWYEIPYGCIVPQGVKNLLIAGRPVSVDHAIHSSLRVMPIACSIGQAAGVAASLSVRHEVSPGDLDGKDVRTVLQQMGANL